MHHFKGYGSGSLVKNELITSQMPAIKRNTESNQGKRHGAMKAFIVSFRRASSTAKA